MESCLGSILSFLDCPRNRKKITFRVTAIVATVSFYALHRYTRAERIKRTLLKACTSGDVASVERCFMWLPKSQWEELRECEDKDDNGYTPLKKACTNGHSEVVRVLLDKYGADIDNTGGQTYCTDKVHATPLRIAAWHNHNDILDQLLSRDVSESSVSAALRKASRNGYYEAVSKLLEHPWIDVNAVGKKNRTALHYAAIYGKLSHQQTLLVLLRNGADPNWKELRGQTPLHWATKHRIRPAWRIGLQIEKVRWLLAYGADVNLRDAHNRRPIDRTENGRLSKILHIAHLNQAERKKHLDLPFPQPEV